MNNVMDGLLSKTWFGYLARIVLTFMFWGSGLSKLIDFTGGMGEMAHFGLEPAWAFNAATIIVQLGGSALVILNKWTWLGAGALSVFTALCIPLVHHFWTMEGAERMSHFHTFTEHVSIIGAMMVVAYASVRRS